MQWLFLMLIFSISLLRAQNQLDLSKRYDEISWLCTHNSMNNSEEGFSFPNQNHKITRQLDNGVRALMLDVHLQHNQVVLRHGNSNLAQLLGSKPLLDELKNIKVFLIQHPQAILTIILESYAPADQLDAVWKQAGLSNQVYTHSPHQPWPTLKQLIDQNNRLIVFTDHPHPQYPWLMPIWQYAFETPFNTSNPQMFKNQANRGNLKNNLFILNHFCSNPLPSLSLATEANTYHLLIHRIRQVENTFKHRVNFLAVDFYETGDSIRIIHEINAP